MITETGSYPQIFAKSTDASVCPFLSRTPPFDAINGNKCPGFLKSLDFFCGLRISFIVLYLSPTEIPVVVPSSESTEIVNAVP